MLVLFAALVFGANYHAARNGILADCVKCSCMVKMKFPDFGRGKEPSCSLRFTRPVEDPNSSFESFTEIHELGKMERPFEGCDAVVICDKGSEAELSCDDETIDGETKTIKTVVWAENRCSIRCERKGDITRSHMIQCDKWKRKPAKKKNTRPKDDELGIIPVGSERQSGPFFSELLPAGFSIGQTYNDKIQEIVTETALWRPIEGESGTDLGVLTTMIEGEAEVRSFCTGDETRLIGPNTITLPTCAFDSLGRWGGTYGRRLPKRVTIPVNVLMDLRREGRSLVGELTTPEGTYKITSFYQTSSSVEVKGTGTFGGKQRDIQLFGSPGKGEIIFQGREGTPGEISTPIIGFVRRLYISDNALPPAVVGHPYIFTFVASSPVRSATTFALAEGKLPRGITLDGQSGTLHGTPSETGKFNIRVTVTDTAGGSFDQPFTLEVKKMALVARWLPDAIIGQPYAVTLKVLGGRPPYKFTGGVPAGLALNPATGEITGTPTRPNSAVYTVYFTDSQNLYDGDALRLTVRGTTITNSHYLPDVKKGTPVRFQFNAIGNSQPIKWYLSGNVLPMTTSGFSIDSQTGELTGPTNTTGTFVFSVTARGGEMQTRKFSLTVTP